MKNVFQDDLEKMLAVVSKKVIGTRGDVSPRR
jgi:hypothetical protein